MQNRDPLATRVGSTCPRPPWKTPYSSDSWNRKLGKLENGEWGHFHGALPLWPPDDSTILDLASGLACSCTMVISPPIPYAVHCLCPRLQHAAHYRAIL